MAQVKVILRQDVPNLGSAGEIKQVAPGYFRNYLAPRGLATEATPGQIKALQNDKNVRASQLNKAREQASALAGQLGQITITIPVRVGELGRLFGSVTSQDIADALQEQRQMIVDRHKIELAEPLRSLGVHTVGLRLEHGVDAELHVDLVPEGAEAPA